MSAPGGAPGTASAGAQTGSAPAAGAGKSADSGKAAAPSGSSTAMNADTVRQAQEQLAAKGHDPGPIDGVMGEQTRAAAKSFQQAQGMEASGELDGRTLAALGVSPAARSN